MTKKYWLLKSEPEDFSIEDLIKSKNKTTCWSGVRNYQARNFIRDYMKINDGVLFYQSNTEPTAVVAACMVVKESYPDTTQFDPNDNHYFPIASKDKPVWFMVDIKLEQIFSRPVTLQQIKANLKLANMRLVQRGNRLSVMPVTKEEWDEIIRMSARKS